MPTRGKDPSQKAAALVAKATKTRLPKGEDLLGSLAVLAELAKAKQQLKSPQR